jgi:MarR family transcriptional regulator for hemolysin
MPKDRAAEPRGGPQPNPPPSEAFQQYGQWYEQGSAEDLRFRFTSLLREAMRRWRVMLEEELRAVGQTRAQWETLLVIVLSGERSTQKSLARRLRIEGPTLVRLLDKLEEDELIQRVQTPNDRRSKTIRPTRKGLALVRRLVKRTDQLRAGYLEGWSDEELKEGLALLGRLVHAPSPRA